MKKEKIIIPVGNNKALIYDADLSIPHEKKFADEVSEVAKTKPGSIQEFFTRLAELQKEGKITDKEKQIPKGAEIVYIGIVPGVNNLAGVPFRTDLPGSYHTDLESCKYQCEINGGKNHYFFIEERYFLRDKPQNKKLGEVHKIHHFNQELKLKTIKGERKIVNVEKPSRGLTK